MPGFAGTKWTQDVGAAARWALRLVPSRDAPGMSRDPAVIHRGGNSGYQAVNLAAHLGARRIVLLGFDMRVVNGRRHWFGDHPGQLNMPSDYAQWVRRFETAAEELMDMGIEVINATPGSALPWFTMMPIEAALE